MLDTANYILRNEPIGWTRRCVTTYTGPDWRLPVSGDTKASFVPTPSPPPV
ncbi:MAG: hypothetical protein R2712_12045 [Vicinamibacterales bacterium]